MSSEPIMYHSTNHNPPRLTYKGVLLQGQALDKGLYVPERLPVLSSDVISSMKNLSYSEIAFVVNRAFLTQDEMPDNVLEKIVKESYDWDIPLERVSDRTYIMRLDRGPTAAFKDFAAQLMAREMEYYRETELNILTATSGDTGGAVGKAFKGRDGITMYVFYPKHDISDRQRMQMTTLGENIFAVAVRGTFDDCQRLVKRAFADPDLKYLNLTSANSINFGRIKPQIIYYLYAYSHLANGKDMVCSVPCGNFGNLIGGLYAKEMGAKIKKFVVATNENNEFPRFMETGVYEPVSPSKKCPSNAMDVGHPSNLARVFDLYGGWIMDERNESGKVIRKGVIKRMPDINRMKNDIFSTSVSNLETTSVIGEVYRSKGILLEPHGAIAWEGLQRYLAENDGDEICVALETAHPAKFPEEVSRVTGVEPELPESMKKLNELKERLFEIGADYKECKEFLLDMALAA